jgi:Ca-activated chloride channel family protein
MDLAKGAQAVAPREEVAAEAPEARPALDPNARYATTYRPGGAALSAFDAAVGRGDIPAEYKDLVGDFGARYASTMAAPTDAALAFRAEPERSKVAPSGGRLNFRISLRSSATETVRAPLSVHLVLDVSGSMSGNAMDNARKAAQSLVERLDAKDDFSMVTFSSSAEVLVADGPVGPRRKKILETIEQVHANGGTNISAGLDLGYAQAHDPKISPEAVKIVMFLSDGHANGGDTRPESLAERSARAFQDGIQTSAFGLGADFDAPLMSSIADRGAGGYYFLADSSQIAGALAKEMDSRLVPAALGVEVRVRLRPDVIPLRVYGSHALEQREAAQVRAQEVAMDVNAAKKQGIARDRQEDAPGGMRFFMPAFAKDDRHAILMELQVPPGTGSRPLGSVEIKYKDRVRKRNTTDELPVAVVYASSDPESAASADPSVVATVQAFLAGDSIVQAERLVDRELRLPATRLLQERAEILKRAATTLADQRLGEDAIRLARLSRAIGGGTAPESVKSVPLAVLLRGSAYGYLK